MKEPIRVLSDLHLAHPACRIDSIDQVLPLVEGAATVIFNGDTVEQRHSRLREAGETLLRELVKACRDREVEAHFLRGNHDPEVSGTDYLDLPGGIFVSHGDALFPHVSPWNPKVWPVRKEMDRIREEAGEERIEFDLETALEVTQRCRYLSRGDEDQFSGNRFERIRSAARLVWPPRRPLEILRCWWRTPRLAGAFLDRHRPGARFFLFGHTHRPGIWESPSPAESGERSILVNTGGFLSVGGAQLVEIEGDSVRVCPIVESGGDCRAGEPIRIFSKKM